MVPPNGILMKIFLSIILAAVLATAMFGCIRLASETVTDGKCIAEFTTQRYDRTAGVAIVHNAVIESGDDTFNMPNMTCLKFRNPVNVFKYTHPYFALYSILTVAIFVTVIGSLAVASLFVRIERIIERLRNRHVRNR